MISYHAWTELPIQIRHKIAAQFNIPKKGATEVFDNQIKSDGYLVKDIYDRLNTLSIQMYLETKETDMSKLWTWMVEKIEGRPLTQFDIDTTAQEQNVIHPSKPDSKEVRKELIAKNEFIHDAITKKPKRGRKPKAK